MVAAAVAKPVQTATGCAASWRHLGGALCLALAIVWPASGETPPTAPDAASAYAESRAFMALGRYDDALAPAEAYLRLVQSRASSSVELATAMTNIGAVQWRRGQLAAAEAHFLGALQALESTEGMASRRLIEPLLFLGRVHADQGRHEDAVRDLDRAVGISRRADGLFNVEQLGMLESLVASYQQLGDVDAVERVRRYALQVSEQKRGPGDARTLAARARLADWLERTDQYPLAREQYRTIVASAGAEGGDDLSPELIRGLLGVARTYRLQFVHDPASLESSGREVDPVTGRPAIAMMTATVVSASKPDREGELAARRALAALDSVPDPPADLLVDTLIELGDWYMTSRRPEAATPFYSRAWDLLQGLPDDARLALLRVPQPLLYRAPPAARRSKERWEGVLEPRPIEFSMTIGPAGVAADIVLVSEDAPPGQVGQLRRALEQAMFRPAFAEGRPAVTHDHRMVEFWYEADPAAGIEPAT